MSEKKYSGFVALVGRPNAGKSTLMNKLIGQKVAIMSDKPQTTRNRIVGVLNKDDYQIIYLDTPGIHKPANKLGEYMVSTTLNTLLNVDLIYYLIDATVPFGRGDAFIIEKLKKTQTPVFLIMNKVDLLEKVKLLPLIEFYREKMSWEEIVPVSALTGENSASLVEATLKYLPEGPLYYPPEMVTDQPERMVIAEIIREKVIGATWQEIPHAVAVDIELMEEREQSIYIGANIFIERESQKGIIIGKNGEMLKKIGSQARIELEKMLGSRVFLEMRVKVKRDWRNREKNLYDLGFTE